MGDTKKIRKKYSRPSHPWRASRITEENQISKDFGIPRKTEIWKAIAKLESFKNQTKKLSALTTKQAEMEKKNLILKLESYGLVQKGDSTDIILGVGLKDVLNRRLQTIVVKKGLARTMKQARQMITHRHILVNNKLLTSPSYLVRVSEEAKIELAPKSPFYDTAHPERTKEAKKAPKVREEQRRPRQQRRR